MNIAGWGLVGILAFTYGPSEAVIPPPIDAFQSNEPIGTTARLGVMRLGAGRLGALPSASQLKAGTGIYAWIRSDGAEGEINDGRHPDAVTGGWITGRS